MTRLFKEKLLIVGIPNIARDMLIQRFDELNLITKGNKATQVTNRGRGRFLIIERVHIQEEREARTMPHSVLIVEIGSFSIMRKGGI